VVPFRLRRRRASLSHSSVLTCKSSKTLTTDSTVSQCWFLLTFLTALSFKPLRKKFYELFYWSHIILVIGVLVTAIVHHQVRLQFSSFSSRSARS